MDILHYDLCVIGGGINGAGIARDAAGRGLSVLLIEEGDLAGATSSASTKLIHGGLRYLEYREFLMVHQALKERETLLRNAPHLIYPIECVLPVDHDVRPRWMLRLGVWLYDHLGGKKTVAPSRFVDCGADGICRPLNEGYEEAVIYSDCWGDDTRLVVMNAVDAAARDAKILTHTRCCSLSVFDGRWKVGLRDMRSGDVLDVTASMVVNATGPWVGQFLSEMGVGLKDPDLPTVRLVKGSHLIFHKLYDGDQTYVLQQPDGRIVFVSPYEGQYTLVGTTEEDYDGIPRDARISDQEMEYLCAAVNDAFKKQVKPTDAIFSFSGVRPLLDDGQESASEVSRDYLIYHHTRSEAPLLSIFGGKLTTYRALSEDVVDRLMQVSGRSARGWTADLPLMGGDFEGLSYYKFLSAKRAEYSWLPESLLVRYVRSYGTCMGCILHGAESLDDLGEYFGDSVYEAELSYLKNYEWASSAEDVVWRRSKLGLHISEDTLSKIDAYFSG
ncbi:MAG: glycerol-3-phosphate dehydrogenase [Alphaproteobacteria bacterium]